MKRDLSRMGSRCVAETQSISHRRRSLTYWLRPVLSTIRSTPSCTPSHQSRRCGRPTLAPCSYGRLRSSGSRMFAALPRHCSTSSVKSQHQQWYRVCARPRCAHAIYTTYTVTTNTRMDPIPKRDNAAIDGRVEKQTSTRANEHIGTTSHA